MKRLSIRVHQIHLLLLLDALAIAAGISCINGLFFSSCFLDACFIEAVLIGIAIGSVVGVSATSVATGCNLTNAFSFASTLSGAGRNRVIGLRAASEGLTSCCVISREAFSKSNAKDCTVGYRSCGFFAIAFCKTTFTASGKSTRYTLRKVGVV